MQKKQETRVITLSQEDLLEEEMATCFGIFAWEIPWISMDPMVGYSPSCGQKELNMTEHTHTHTHTHTHVNTGPLNAEKVAETWCQSDVM